MTFRVGQEVVCVDDRPHPSAPYTISGLVKGNIYTLTKVCMNWDGLAVHLAEILHDENYVGFRAERFRPIVKTDISIFTAMLAPSPKKTVSA